MKIKLTLLFLFLIFFSGTLDLNNLFNYANLEIPNYIDPVLDNVPADNPMDDKLATLGRVLFYDEKLSADNETACASCHKQNHAFGDPQALSIGSNGTTLRHAMRLTNIRFTAEETHFFWDEREATIEDLVTKPIRDHVEMGYSGTNGAPGFQDLIEKMEQLYYYPLLFSFAFGEELINEDRIQKALAQFLRSIQSFDSKFDEGMALANGDINQNFPNFTEGENIGKMLYLQAPIFAPNSADRVGGGLGCGTCHGLNAFAFQSEAKNNGLITETDGTETLNISKSPSLRNLFSTDGLLLGPVFHDASAETFAAVLNHYSAISWNPNLDDRLIPFDTIPQKLHMTLNEEIQLQSFIMALTGHDVFYNEKWADPFDEEGSIDVISVGLNMKHNNKGLKVFPNPANNFICFEFEEDDYSLQVYDVFGQLVLQKTLIDPCFDCSNWSSGLYFVKLLKPDGRDIYSQKVLKK